MSAHVHAESMRLYAEDAAETDKPWERWDISSYRGVWVQCQCHPKWDLCVQYRRKPRTININGIEVPEPLREAPEIGSYFWVPNIPIPSPYRLSWEGKEVDFLALRAGLAYRTKEAADTHGRALASFTEVSDGE